ncbi:MAG: penicillin-binding protein 2 [Cyanobacteria bacterium NC_groundwater_1444_Ag_S-0.65um_54_12]|nr:penicillin-binding protein 2 [Cyanobacteria bacterium NC_groundwater_1444_Ag_S-0.65um_54_12]
MLPAARSKLLRRRIRWLQVLVWLAGALLCGRLAYLQIWEADHLGKLARAQRTKRIDLASLRGEIVDRNGQELAVSVEAWSVYAQPAELKASPAVIAAKLSPLVGISPQKLAETLRDRHWCWIARQQENAVAQQVRALKLAGIGLVRETRRVYPKGELAATLIGFVGIDNQGLAGIEHDFDKLLKGPPRYLDIQVDAMGREILRESNDSPLDILLTDGARVTLTLDEIIQHQAQYLLQQAIANLGAQAGSVIVLDPHNGDVLAFATLPTYDPNLRQKVDLTLTRNSAVSSVFEPGSTLKPFTVAAALEAGVITTESVIDCPPRLTIGNQTIGDHDPPPSVRRLAVPQIIQVSSNVGTAQIGMRMSDKVQRSLLERIGFGRSTDSGMGGESAGLLPKLPWRPINHATISYGQGISVTALQLVTAECIFANGGYRIRPRLIRKIVAPDGRMIADFPPAPPQRVLSPHVVTAMGKMLRKVTETGGTGAAARIPGYQVAGKTGTAQKVNADGRGYSNDVVASFVGYAPAEHPRIVVLASLDSPKYAHFASQTAAPLFRDVAAASLRVLGALPDPAVNMPGGLYHATD